MFVGQTVKVIEQT